MRTHTAVGNSQQKFRSIAVLCEHIPVFFITSHSRNESPMYVHRAVWKIQYGPERAVNLPRLNMLHVNLYPCQFSLFMRFPVGMWESTEEKRRERRREEEEVGGMITKHEEK